MKEFLILFVVCSVLFPSFYASAESITLDKSSYVEGDLVIVSGDVNYTSDYPSGTIQIITPDGGNFASIGAFTPNLDGSFSSTFQTGGTWNVAGTYNVKVFYATDVFEIPLVYQLYSDSLDDELSSTVTSSPSGSSEFVAPLLREFSLNKSSYIEDGVVIVSGVADYHLDYPVVTLRIIHPNGNLIGISSPYVESNGDFSATFNIGSSWDVTGTYVVKAFYVSDILQQSLDYEIPSNTTDISTTTDTSDTVDATDTSDTVDNTDISTTTDTSDTVDALTLASFVDPTKDPQSYVDRYNNEEVYKKWFDDNFANYDSIYQAVGLNEPLELALFVDPQKDPQSYVDRYYDEDVYKDWFDMNFPQYSSIYQAVGLPVPFSDLTSVEPSVDIDLEESNDAEPVFQCGSGTELVNGSCKVITIDESKSEGFFDSLMRMFANIFG